LTGFLILTHLGAGRVPPYLPGAILYKRGNWGAAEMKYIIAVVVIVLAIIVGLVWALILLKRFLDITKDLERGNR